MRRPITRTRPTLDLANASKGALDGFAGARQPAARPGREVSGDETRRAVSINARLSADDATRLAHLAETFEGNDIISDAEAARRAGQVEHRNTAAHIRNQDNLPAVMQPGALSVNGRPINPTWHTVKHLPGYLANAIRSVGRQAFSPFTRTAIEDIQLNSTMTGSEYETRAVMKWIAENGTYIEQPDMERMDFAGLLNAQGQGRYEANVRLYVVDQVEFLLVKDQAGHYIYSWPLKDSKRPGAQLAIDEGEDQLSLPRPR